MHTKKLAFILIFLATPLMAGEPTIVLLADGTAWFSKGDGSPTILIKNIIRPPGEMPPKDPDEDPDDSDPTEFRQKVTALGKAVNDPVGAALLAKGYQVLKGEVKSGKIPATTNDVDEALTAVVDKTIQLIPGDHKSEWKKVHEDIIGELAVRLIANGGKLSAAQYGEFFGEAQGGLEDVADGAAVPPFLEKLLEALVEILIDWIKGRFGS